MCDKSFKYKADRNRHVTHVHEKLEATISCKLCPKKFINKVRLERHQLTNNGNVFKCTFEGCTSSRNTKYSLSHHFQQKHAKVNHRKSLEERLAAEREKNQKLLCDLCKIWIKQKSMAVHLKTHENKTTMNCIVGDCLEEIYFTRDKSSHTYNLPSKFYEHLTKQHEVDFHHLRWYFYLIILLIKMIFTFNPRTRNLIWKERTLRSQRRFFQQRAKVLLTWMKSRLLHKKFTFQKFCTIMTI